MGEEAGEGGGTEEYHVIFLIVKIHSEEKFCWGIYFGISKYVGI